MNLDWNRGTHYCLYSKSLQWWYLAPDMLLIRKLDHMTLHLRRAKMIDYFNLKLTNFKSIFQIIKQNLKFFPTFNPCSSVPVDKITLFPCSRLNRAVASASKAVYKCPMCGARKTYIKIWSFFND